MRFFLLRLIFINIVLCQSIHILKLSSRLISFILIVKFFLNFFLIRSVFPLLLNNFYIFLYFIPLPNFIGFFVGENQFREVNHQFLGLDISFKFQNHLLELLYLFVDGWNVFLDDFLNFKIISLSSLLWQQILRVETSAFLQAQQFQNWFLHFYFQKLHNIVDKIKAK